MTGGNPCVGHRGYHREYKDVLDTGTAGTVRPRGPDGPRMGGRRLLGTLPEVRHHETGAGNAGRSATSAVGVGAARPEKVALSCSRFRGFGSRRAGASGQAGRRRRPR